MPSKDPDYYKKYTASHLEQKAKTARLRGDTKMKRLIRYKKTLQCSKCGEKDFRCLDFHHVNPKNKKGTIAQLVRRYSWEIVEFEIKKCKVLCSNCHRKIHIKI